MQITNLFTELCHSFKKNYGIWAKKYQRYIIGYIMMSKCDITVSTETPSYIFLICHTTLFPVFDKDV